MQVYIHLTVSTEAGDVLRTTRPELEGSGVPVPFIVGKGRRPPRGWELAVKGAPQGPASRITVPAQLSWPAPPAGTSTLLLRPASSRCMTLQLRFTLSDGT